MPANRFSVWHYLFIALFTVVLAYSQYRGLTHVANLPQLHAGIITFASALISLTFWSSLTANPTRFEAPLEAYKGTQLLLWFFVILLSAGYAFVFTMVGLVAIGIEPSGSVLLAALIGAILGSYVFKRTFVPLNWGPYAKPESSYE